MGIRRGFLQGAIAAALLYAGCSSPQAQKAPAPAADPAKIIAFYARDTVVTEGGNTLLCYGVSNAKSVRIDPPVEGVSPSLTRCVEIRPKGETRYTLTAVGADGQAVSHARQSRQRSMWVTKLFPSSSRPWSTSSICRIRPRGESASIPHSR